MEQGYTIRQAEKKDIPYIIDFIKENWNENHIFVRNKAFFEYMLCEDDSVNIIVAVDSDNKIYGMEGCTFYNSSKNPDSSGMMWRCLKSKDVLLGVEIDQYLKSYKDQRFHFGIGSNPNTALKITKKLYKHLTGKMDHFYRLNEKEQYKICVVCHKDILRREQSSSKLIELHGEEELKSVVSDSFLKQFIPFKDIKYLIKRYISHPIYSYHIYVIERENNMTNSILITRVVEARQARAIKIVDFIGKEEDLLGLTYEFDRLMKETDSEYIDLYCVGLKEETLNSAGFIRLQENDTNIIPNYFEPFEQKNVDIYYTTPHLNNVKLFRGDADQDRPNF